MEKRVAQNGQVGIIMLLITVVMLTVGISAVSRSTSDVSISTTNEQANKALDAAESGLEQAMSQTDLSGYAPGTVVVGDNKVTTVVTPKTTLQTSVDQGYTVGVNLKGNTGGSITIQWAKETSCATQASLVLTILNTAGGATPPVRRYYVGPSCRSGDGFTAATNIAGTYHLQYVVGGAQLFAGDEVMRIRPLYNASDIQVSGVTTTQQYTVRSTAQNDTSKETKAVEVDRTLPVAPSVLDYVLYSGTSIEQTP